MRTALSTSTRSAVCGAERSRLLSDLQAFLCSEGILAPRQAIARALRLTRQRVYRPWSTRTHLHRPTPRACIVTSRACERTFLRALGVRTYRRHDALGLYLFHLLGGAQREWPSEHS